MSNTLSGTTLFISSDNQMYSFNTEFITQSPLSAFIPYYTGFITINDLKIIKLSLFSSVIQAYILLATGTRIFPLSNSISTINQNTDHVSDSLEIVNTNYSNTIMTSNEETDEISKFIDDDDIFKDFNDFLKDSMFESI